MNENTPWIIEYMRNRTAYVPPTIEERRARHDAYREQAKAEIEKARQDILDWTAKWPDHCPYCKGHGGTYSEYDSSPAGVGLAPGTMTDFEPCEHCIGANARLIAAAPDLYEALAVLHTLLDFDDEVVAGVAIVTENPDRINHAFKVARAGLS